MLIHNLAGARAKRRRLPAARDAVSVVVAAGVTATTEDCDGARMLEERADGPGPPHLRIVIVFAIRDVRHRIQDPTFL